MKEVFQSDVPDDGIVFEAASFSGVAIHEDANYSGVRTVFTGRLDAVQVQMQIDTGFGDKAYPWRIKRHRGI
jgi:hypothetical protein